MRSWDVALFLPFWRTKERQRAAQSGTRNLRILGGPRWSGGNRRSGQHWARIAVTPNGDDLSVRDVNVLGKRNDAEARAGGVLLWQWRLQRWRGKLVAHSCLSWTLMVHFGLRRLRGPSVSSYPVRSNHPQLESLSGEPRSVGCCRYAGRPIVR